MKPFGPARLTWIFLIILIAFLESAFIAFICPLKEGADEAEHADQALHWAVDARLPDLETEDVGQAQHPPLAYLVLALVQKIGGQDDAPPRAVGTGVDILGRRVLFRPEHRQIDEDEVADWASPRHQAAARTREMTYRAMRSISVLLGLFSSILLVLILREFFPEQPGLVVGTSAFFLLLPLWAAHFAFISCDPYLTFLACLATWLFLRLRRRGELGQWKKLLPTSFILGLSFLTKLHAFGIATFLALIILGDRRSNPKLSRRLLSCLVLAAGPLLIAGWWHVLRIVEAGGPLVLDHHAAMKPWLLRLQEFHPVVLLDVLHHLQFSFMGVFGASSIVAPIFFFILPMTLCALAIVGCFWPRGGRRGRSSGSTRAVSSEKTDSEATLPLEEAAEPRAPIGAALFAFALLVIAILIANRHYLHIHGRYLLAILPVLALMLAHGLRVLTGEKAEGLLKLGAAWNLVFLIWTMQVTLTQTMTVPSSKFERGQVLAYRDCGHRFFDDRGAGGVPAVRQMRHLSLASHTIRATADESLHYDFEVADRTRPLQLRLRYPDPALRGQGDLPMPSGIECFVDGMRLHGLVSIGLDRGELVYLIPAEAQEDGQLRVTWRNRAAGAQGLALAEIWLEESWLQVDALALDPIRKVVSFNLRNIDGSEAHGYAFDLFDAAGPIDVPADRTRGRLGAGSSEHIRIEVARKVDGESLRLRLRPDYVGPEVDFKLVYNRLPGTKRSGLARLADIETILVAPDDEARDLSAADLDTVPDGLFGLGIEHSPAHAGLVPEILALDLEGATLELPWVLEEGRDGMSLSKTTLNRESSAAPLRFLLRLVTAPQTAIHLNRLLLERRLDDTSWGQTHAIDPGE